MNIANLRPTLAISKSTSTTSKGPTSKRYPKAIRHEAIVRASNGEKPRNIAKDLNVSVTTIYKWCRVARLDGIVIPDLRYVDHEERNWPKAVKLNADLTAALEEERTKRGYPSVTKLLHDVLKIMVEEPNLFDAVLDND